MIGRWFGFLVTAADEDLLDRPGRAAAAIVLAFVSAAVVVAAWAFITEWFWPLGLAIVGYWLYRLTMLVLDKEKKQ